MDNEGAGWVDLSEATPDELFNIELGLVNGGAFDGSLFMNGENQ